MESTNAPQLLHARVAWIYLWAQVILAVIYAAGVLSDLVYAFALVGTCCSITLGVRRNQPARRWHWWALVGAAIFGAAASVARDNVTATGILTDERSLLPDVFAVPFYLIMGAALTGLLRSRRSKSDGRDRSAWLDSALVALGALLLAWVFAIGPTFSYDEAWLPAQIEIAMYPPMSAVLVAIACRLAFGSNKRSPSHQFVFAGTVCFLVGDIAFAMAEVGRLPFGRLYELPFLIGSALFGAAALHPSMRHLHQPSSRFSGKLTTTRLAMLAVALMLPAVVAVSAPDSSGGAQIFLAINLVAVALTAATRLVFTVREQSQNDARLVHQATHDDLTGVANRMLALEVIEDCLRRNEQTGKTLAVYFLDLDRFKLINDSMGHCVGDELLVAASLRLASVVRSGDTVARISGDEFLVICDDIDVKSATALAERIRTSFNECFELSAGRVFASSSIGVALTDTAVRTNGPSLIRDADTAMYRSKELGRDTVTFFGLEMRERVERRVELERLMRNGLDTGEFIPHFQPIVTMPEGRIEGFEALARWPRTEGDIYPSEFIPVAEESGLIVQLGARILDEACRQLAHWRATEPGAENLYMSVNLSPRQVLESDIVDTVADVLERHGLPGDALWLEITEGVMMEDTVEIQAVLNALCGLGLSLSVDDFGTGFSSLSYLKRFPVSKVKIDKSFVDGLEEGDADDSLVQAIIGMARALKLTTIAEGVEKIEQANKLFELGCENAQGYYFARPMPGNDVPAAIRELLAVH